MHFWANDDVDRLTQDCAALILGGKHALIWGAI
jgi:hypothetical protein